MREKKEPLGGLAAAREAGEKTGYYQYISLYSACQANFTPISYIIRRIFIESFVSQRYTAKNSLRVDGLLTLSEFLERCGHVNN